MLQGKAPGALRGVLQSAVAALRGPGKRRALRGLLGHLVPLRSEEIIAAQPNHRARHVRLGALLHLEAPRVLGGGPALVLVVGQQREPVVLILRLDLLQLLPALNGLLVSQELAEEPIFLDRLLIPKPCSCLHGQELRRQEAGDAQALGAVAFAAQRTADLHMAQRQRLQRQLLLCQGQVKQVQKVLVDKRQERLIQQPHHVHQPV
mmetsp:Transcript_118673/g.281664  ORF Transcript_118673/g.281664 Transcript_118673/m.281664 type:complete len:206 (-) Transcript_118673:539-1156(-)